MAGLTNAAGVAGHQLREILRQKHGLRQWLRLGQHPPPLFRYPDALLFPLHGRESLLFCSGLLVLLHRLAAFPSPSHH